MENIQVKNVIIPKQIENSENYERFIEIVKEKQIYVIQVQAGDKVYLDKQTYFDIIWPEKEQISENVLNNNSIVAKLNYNQFSVLFTGDIEAIAEKQIIKKYGTDLKANIVKVAHHGSKSSTIQEFVNLVKPQIALIGVGEKNTFGHPNSGVLLRLKSIGTRVFRTDKCGEVSIVINKHGKIKIGMQINV